MDAGMSASRLKVAMRQQLLAGDGLDVPPPRTAPPRNNVLDYSQEFFPQMAAQQQPRAGLFSNSARTGLFAHAPRTGLFVQQPRAGLMTLDRRGMSRMFRRGGADDDFNDNTGEDFTEGGSLLLADLTKGPRRTGRYTTGGAMLDDTTPFIPVLSEGGMPGSGPRAQSMTNTQYRKNLLAQKKGVMAGASRLLTMTGVDPRAMSMQGGYDPRAMSMQGRPGMDPRAMSMQGRPGMDPRAMSMQGGYDPHAMSMQGRPPMHNGYDPRAMSMQGRPPMQGRMQGRPPMHNGYDPRAMSMQGRPHMGPNMPSHPGQPPRAMSFNTQAPPPGWNGMRQTHLQPYISGMQPPGANMRNGDYPSLQGSQASKGSSGDLQEVPEDYSLGAEPQPSTQQEQLGPQGLPRPHVGTFMDDEDEEDEVEEIAPPHVYQSEQLRSEPYQPQPQSEPYQLLQPFQLLEPQVLPQQSAPVPTRAPSPPQEPSPLPAIPDSLPERAQPRPVSKQLPPPPIEDSDDTASTGSGKRGDHPVAVSASTRRRLNKIDMFAPLERRDLPQRRPPPPGTQRRPPPESPPRATSEPDMDEADLAPAPQQVHRELVVSGLLWERDDTNVYETDQFVTAQELPLGGLHALLLNLSLGTRMSVLQLRLSRHLMMFDLPEEKSPVLQPEWIPEELFVFNSDADATPTLDPSSRFDQYDTSLPRAVMAPVPASELPCMPLDSRGGFSPELGPTLPALLPLVVSIRLNEPEIPMLRARPDAGSVPSTPRLAKLSKTKAFFKRLLRRGKNADGADVSIISVHSSIDRTPIESTRVLTQNSSHILPQRVLDPPSPIKNERAVPDNIEQPILDDYAAELVPALLPLSSSTNPGFLPMALPHLQTLFSKEMMPYLVASHLALPVESRHPVSATKLSPFEPAVSVSSPPTVLSGPVFNKEDLGIMQANTALLRELQLVLRELAGLIKREIALEERLRGRAGGSSPTPSGPNPLLLPQEVAQLTETLVAERRARYVAEEHVVLWEQGREPLALRLNQSKMELEAAKLELEEDLRQLQQREQRSAVEADELRRRMEQAEDETHRLKFVYIPELKELLQAREAAGDRALRREVELLRAENAELAAHTVTMQQFREVEAQRDELRKVVQELRTAGRPLLLRRASHALLGHSVLRASRLFGRG